MADQAQKPVYYWDTCIFIALINETPERSPVIETILEEARKGNIELFTSMFTIAEVVYQEPEKQSRILDSLALQNIDKFWTVTSPITLAEASRLVFIEARRLMREAMENDLKMKVADAIHLATARRCAASEIHTYDDKWKKFQSFVDIKICAPHTDKLPFTGRHSQQTTEPSSPVPPHAE